MGDTCHTLFPFLFQLERVVEAVAALGTLKDSLEPHAKCWVKLSIDVACDWIAGWLSIMVDNPNTETPKHIMGPLIVIWVQ